MDSRLKQRLIGAAVLVALAVIFLPMLVKGPAPDSGVSDLSLQLPDRPQPAGTVTRDLPLVAPRPAPEEGALGLGARPRDEASLATVDTAAAPHPDAAELADRQPVEPEPDAAVAAVRPEPPAATPAPAVEAPSPLPATTAGGGYAVHFGSYSSSVNADVVVNRLRQAGFPASSSQASVGGRQVWRVRIGPYANRAQAETVRVRAATVGDNDARVVALDAEPAPVASAPAPAPATPPPAAPVPAPTAPPAQPPAPAVAAETGFVVQLGAFSNAAEAGALRDRARAAGFTTFTDTVSTDRGTLTRVKVGPVLSRAEADRLKAQVQSRLGIADGMVRSHP